MQDIKISIITMEICSNPNLSQFVWQNFTIIKSYDILCFLLIYKIYFIKQFNEESNVALRIRKRIFPLLLPRR